MTHLSEFFAMDLCCANCGGRFLTRARDGRNLCHPCWAELDEAVRSTSGAARRRCA